MSNEKTVIVAGDEKIQMVATTPDIVHKPSILYQKREIDPHLTDKECAWTEWTRGLIPVLNESGNWYTRDEVSLGSRYDKIKPLSTTVAGIYEYGARYKDQGDIICVYVGRAHKVNKNSTGCTLRARIYSGYCKNGSDSRYELGEYLKRGFHIYFRWCPLLKITEIKQLEIHLLQNYDYAFNTEHSISSYRKPEHVMHASEKITLFEYIESLSDFNAEQLNLLEQVKLLFIQNGDKTTNDQKHKVLTELLNYIAIVTIK
jgi:hypothetical protein